MRHFIIAALLALGAAAPAQAADSKADSWGIQNERAAIVSGEVVDIACSLTGDCPAACGAGARQLGILQADGVLLTVAKNGQPFFNGAVDDLLPHCKKKIDADGLIGGNDEAKIFQIQTIRAAGATEWVKTERWAKVWAEKNPKDAAAVEEWYLHDPRVAKQIEANGYLGLGAAADVVFAKKP